MEHKWYKQAVMICIMPVLLLLFLCSASWGEWVVKGSTAPDFELKDSDGRTWRLSDLRGKVVFISFWSTWCPACNDEMSPKEALYEKMQGRPFQMIGILFRDNPDNLVDFFKKKKVRPPTLISPDNEAAKKYGIIVIPVTFIIDKEGIIREKIVGTREWDSPEIILLIEKWL